MSSLIALTGAEREVAGFRHDVRFVRPRTGADADRAAVAAAEPADPVALAWAQG
ncbi:MAG: hypothetical protein V4579_07895 [Pseudomonadota bacterium]